MKKSAFILLTILISISAFSQKLKAKCCIMPHIGSVLYDDVTPLDTAVHSHSMQIIITEDDVYRLYRLLSWAKQGIGDAQDVSVYQATHIFMPFADTLTSVLAAQSQQWHPVPPAPKPAAPIETDSTSKK